MRGIAIVVLTLFFSSACAEAKPRPTVVVKKPSPKASLLEYVDVDDAARALLAESDFRAAQIRWDAARRLMQDKYRIDPDKGEGWDLQADGKLRARRSTGN